jgi:hypothetical protein
MKHKHYDKIVAKAANMNLVVFCRDAYHVEEGWFETHNLPIQDEFDYYLCLPQHKEACLAWLNGANINFTSDVWSDVVAEVKAQSLKEGFLLGYKQCGMGIDQGSAPQCILNLGDNLGDASMTQAQKAALKKSEALKRLGKAGNAKQLADNLQRTLQTLTR